MPGQTKPERRYGQGGDDLSAPSPQYRLLKNERVAVNRGALRWWACLRPNLSEALKAQTIAEAATRSLTSGQMETIGYPSLTRDPRLQDA